MRTRAEHEALADEGGEGGGWVGEMGVEGRQGEVVGWRWMSWD